ncbi:MAG: anthranilate synthase component I family protein [Methanocellales archaeon]|nr:anthranilate synthase component I family protein [Methanocellales archaeon]
MAMVDYMDFEEKVLTNSVRRIDVHFDPLKVYSAIREFSGGKSFLLESVEGGARTARYSFIGFDPLFEFRSKGKTVEVNGENFQVENPYRELERIFKRFRCGRIDILPFSGGMVGFFSYDIVRFFENIPDLLGDDLHYPDAHFIIPAHILCFDHIKRDTFLISYANGAEKIEQMVKKGSYIGEFSLSSTESNMARDEFENNVIKAKEYIEDGEIFQVVLSRRLTGTYDGDLLHSYKILREINPSPYMFYLDFGDTKVAGSSPEMLVRLRDEELMLRPLAGTRPRGVDVEEDEKLKLNMLLDAKERAEHIMLVDLGRNDLGRVAEYGSVKVNDLCSVEKYSHVQHIVSNITARLKKDKSAFDALRATFPAGTVSGAPKIRAMEIIEELENTKRGPYAGAVGYFDFSGNMDFAITIRTMFALGKKAHFQAGAGIVAESDPEREFYETKHKLGSLVKSVEDDK